MKSSNRAIMGLIPLLLLSLSLSAQNQVEAIKTAFDIVAKQQKDLKDSRQILVVWNEQAGNMAAILVALEKKHNVWKLKYGPMNAFVGRNGFAPAGDKREGDGKSPTGIYRLGHLFTYEARVKTSMPYFQTTKEDKWIDDPESPDYNLHVRGATTAKSFENLLLSSDAYKYCMVIEYNTNPVVKGKGSAIFFHLGDGATAGCVAISERDMMNILHWFRQRHQPRIIMGTRMELIRGKDS